MIDCSLRVRRIFPNQWPPLSRARLASPIGNYHGYVGGLRTQGAVLLRLQIWLGTCLILISCGEVTGLPRSSAVPVVQILLVAGEPSQVASVQYSSPADSLVPRVSRPVRADSVALELIAPDGTHTPFSPVAGLATRFEAQQTVLPGAAYRLAGTVAGVQFSSTVTVPGPLDIRLPLEDTLRLPSTSVTASLEFSWHASGAVSYVVRHLDDTGLALFTQAIADTTGTLLLFPRFDSQAHTTHLAVWAYEQSAMTFFLNLGGEDPVRGEGGAVIGFGAATPASPEKTIIWQGP